MEHHHTASKLAKFGRNGDSMLVHMTPHEVAGLQYLAMSHGGSLTINPDTGLIEAFSLGGLFKSFLPMLIGGALTVFSGGALGPMAAAMMTGAGYGVVKKDWKAGLMAGLGAFGGSGLAGGLMKAGTNSLASQAVAQGAEKAGTSIAQLAAPEAGFNVATAGTGAAQAAGTGAANTLSPVITSGAVPFNVATAGTGAAQATGMEALKAGVSAANPFTTAGRGVLAGVAKGVGYKGLMAAGAPTLDYLSQPAPFKPDKGADPMYYSTSYNPGTYDPAKREFVGAGYGPGTWSKQFPGMPSTDTSATSAPTGKPNSLTAAGLKLNPNYGQPGEPQFIPESTLGMAAGGMTPTGYGPSIDPYTGAEEMHDGGAAGFAAGGLSSLPEYKAGGKLLNGPGDGMSDSIPAVIQGQKPQRAALADGEFVVPADVVSHLGNGSTKAGANQLYAMMDRVRKARTGNPKQGKKINPARFMVA